MLINRAGPGDRQKARRLLSEALASYPRIGMPYRDNPDPPRTGRGRITGFSESARRVSSPHTPKAVINFASPDGFPQAPARTRTPFGPLRTGQGGVAAAVLRSETK
jgi:hypothetical protein